MEKNRYEVKNFFALVKMTEIRDLLRVLFPLISLFIFCRVWCIWCIVEYMINAALTLRLSYFILAASLGDILHRNTNTRSHHHHRHYHNHDHNFESTEYP
jgi:hypothetical protein